MDTNRVKHNIFNSFKSKLNKHGFGFQYRVLKTVAEFIKDRNFPWIPEVSEFPVNIKGINTKIDFIFRNFKYPLLVIAECKRSNPAFSNWCFA